MKTASDYAKPIEELTGSNRGIVRQRLGRFHLSHSLLDAIRFARRGEDDDRARCRTWRSYPRELRRGFILCCAETWAEYRGTYHAVLTGRL